MLQGALWRRKKNDKQYSLTDVEKLEAIDKYSNLLQKYDENQESIRY